ncbi:MAG: hypothetical protein NZ521_03310, partial [Flammeovirgaceae bacterium]|nr:hypothetical protein [Flammeovirgaceae bacterium]MDW8287180.1 hypothetical protein [Flammeovirgaceae bacterium]
CRFLQSLFTKFFDMQRNLRLSVVYIVIVFVIGVVIARWVYAPLAGAMVGVAMLGLVLTGICCLFCFFHRSFYANSLNNCANHTHRTGLLAVCDDVPPPHSSGR